MFDCYLFHSWFSKNSIFFFSLEVRAKVRVLLFHRLFVISLLHCVARVWGGGGGGGLVE